MKLPSRENGTRDRTTGLLTYLPKPGEDPARVVAVLPVLEKPVIIRGDKEQGTVVRYLTFEGLTFSDNHWDVPIETGYRAGRDVLEGDLWQLRPPLWQNAGVRFSSKFEEEYAHLLPLAWPDALPGQSTAAAPGGVSVFRADHITFDSCRFVNFETSSRSVNTGLLAALLTVGLSLNSDFPADTGLPGPTNKTRPNIRFIPSDDLKPLLGCYGDKTIKTPNIDRLASRGTIFRNNMCQQAICGPTRASLMTGMYPDHTRV